MSCPRRWICRRRRRSRRCRGWPTPRRFPPTQHSDPRAPRPAHRWRQRAPHRKLASSDCRRRSISRRLPMLLPHSRCWGLPESRRRRKRGYPQPDLKSETRIRCRVRLCRGAVRRPDRMRRLRSIHKRRTWWRPAVSFAFGDNSAEWIHKEENCTPKKMQSGWRRSPKLQRFGVVRWFHSETIP